MPFISFSGPVKRSAWIDRIPAVNRRPMFWGFHIKGNMPVGIFPSQSFTALPAYTYAEWIFIPETDLHVCAAGYGTDYWCIVVSIWGAVMDPKSRHIIQKWSRSPSLSDLCVRSTEMLRATGFMDRRFCLGELVLHRSGVLSRVSRFIPHDLPSKQSVAYCGATACSRQKGNHHQKNNKLYWVFFWRDVTLGFLVKFVFSKQFQSQKLTWLWYEQEDSNRGAHIHNCIMRNAIKSWSLFNLLFFHHFGDWKLDYAQIQRKKNT